LNIVEQTMVLHFPR